MNKKNIQHILLINPPVYDFAAFDLWAKPLGHLYLSSILKQKNFKVTMLDYMDRHFGGMESRSNKYGGGHYNRVEIQKPKAYENIPRSYARYGIGRDIAEDYLNSISEPDVILVTSVMTYWYPGVWETVESVKKIFPKVPVILGGVYATLCPEHAKKSGADYVAEGDFSALDNIFKDLGFNDAAFLSISGTCNSGGSFADFPAPDFSYYPQTGYAALRMSMGCPFRCSYCAQDVLCGNKYERKPWEKVYEEILSFTKRGINNIAFYDDALLYDADENIKPLLRQAVKEKLGISIHTPNGLHARYLDLELAELMQEASFVMPRFSLETSDSFMQKETGAKVSNDIYVSAMKLLQKAGYKRGSYLTYLLIGMPGQNLKDVEASIKFANDLGSKVSLSEYSVIPKTKDFLKVDKRFAEEPLYHNKSVYPLFNLNNWDEIFRVKMLAKNLNSLL
jgi:radical SAM superfamily enzyme YgiQ (UPF0313 family)